MAVLEKIRVKFGILITVLVALALLSFILDPTTLRSAFDRFSSDNKVGSMNGNSVSYKEFYEQLNTYTEIAKMMGQNPSSEEAQAELRNAAWQSLFDNEVFIPKATAAGLAVGEEEMLDLTQGNGISPVLVQQGIFNDANGVFSREALVNFVQSIDADDSGQSSRSRESAYPCSGGTPVEPQTVARGQLQRAQIRQDFLVPHRTPVAPGSEIMQRHIATPFRRAVTRRGPRPSRRRRRCGSS